MVESKETIISDNIKLSAVPLLSYNSSSKKFIFTEEAENFLTTITKPFGVLTVAGMYRTGKSYLLNKILLEKEGFTVGPTINPCTKGLWLWPELLPGKTEDGEDIDVILIDTEGFGAYDEDINHDTKIFTLAILLSSYFVYNSVGTIDEKTIQSLSFVVNMSKHIQLKSNNYGNSTDKQADDLSVLFPKFCWVLRDFFLKQVDSKGNQISANEYLENVLNYSTISNSKENKLTESKNEVRNLIKAYFKDRRCFTLIRPVEEDSLLQKLPKLKDEELRPDFVKQMYELRKLVKHGMRFKTFQGQRINGEIFCNMVKSFSSAINSGAVPNIENTWTSICKMESLKAYSEAEKNIDILMKELINKCKKERLNKDDFDAECKKIENRCLQILNEKSLGECSDDQILKLKRRIKDKQAYFSKVFDEELKIALSNAIKIIYMKVEKKLLTEKINLNNIQNEVNCIFKSSEIEIDASFSDFNGKYELMQEFKIKIYNLLISQVLKKMVNDYEFKLKESEQMIQNVNLVIEENKIKSEKEINVKDREIDKLNKDFNSLNSELSSMKIKLNSLTDEKSNLLKEAELSSSQLQSKIDDLLNKNKDKDNQYKNLIDKIKVLETSLNEETSKNTNLRKEIDEMKDSHNNKINQLKSKDKESINTYTEKIKELDAANKILNEDLEEMKKKYNENELNLKQIKLDNEGRIKKQDLQISLINEKSQETENNLNTIIEEKQKTIEKLNEKLSILNNQSKSSVEELINNHNKKSQGYEDEIGAYKLKIKAINDQLNEIKITKDMEIQKLKESNEDLSNQVDNLSNSMENMKKQHDETVKQMESKTILYLGKEENATKEKIDNLKSIYDKENADIKKGFEDKIFLLNKNIEDFKKQISAKDSEIRKINADKDFHLEDIKNDKEDLELQVMKLSKEKKLMNDTFKRKEEELNNNFNSKLEAKDLEIEELASKQLSKIIELNKKFEMQMNEMKQMYNLEKEKYEEKIKQDRLVFENYKQEINNSNNLKFQSLECEKSEEIEKLNNLLKENEENITELENNVQIISKEKDALKNENGSLKSIIEKYKKEIENNEAIIEEDSLIKTNLNNELKELRLKLTQNESLLERKSKRIEDLEKTISNDNQRVNTIMEECSNEKKLLQKKIDEANKKITDYHNSSLKNQFGYKRDEALLKQQIEFLNSKIEELNSVMNSNQSKYEKTLCKSIYIYKQYIIYAY